MAGAGKAVAVIVGAVVTGGVIYYLLPKGPSHNPVASITMTANFTSGAAPLTVTYKGAPFDAQSNFIGGVPIYLWEDGIQVASTASRSQDGIYRFKRTYDNPSASLTVTHTLFVSSDAAGQGIVSQPPIIVSVLPRAIVTMTTIDGWNPNVPVLNQVVQFSGSAFQSSSAVAPSGSLIWLIIASSSSGAIVSAVPTSVQGIAGGWQASYTFTASGMYDVYSAASANGATAASPVVQFTI